MKEKMTSGEIAKQAGVSPKALLSEHFEKVALPGPLIFESPEALFDRMLKKYPEGKSFWKITGIKSRNTLTV